LPIQKFQVCPRDDYACIVHQKKKKTLPVEVQRAKLPMHRKYFSPNKNNTKVTKLVYALPKQSVSNQEFGMNILFLST
jgi:hypothetical protein